MPVVQFPIRFAGINHNALLKYDVARVHAGVHQHQADAGFSFAIAQCGLNRRRTAVFGEQRWVNVEGTEPRNPQERKRKNPAVRCQRKKVDGTVDFLRKQMEDDPNKPFCDSDI